MLDKRAMVGEVLEFKGEKVVVVKELSKNTVEVLTSKGNTETVMYDELNYLKEEVKKVSLTDLVEKYQRYTAVSLSHN